jgi:ABC-type phosphate/phosphonate transport system substrate-binding protein
LGGEREIEFTMLASLPMYDWPEIREDTDRFWAVLARELGVSGLLWRGADYKATWQNPELLFSQTCGYPFTHTLRGQVKLVATPHYVADGCEGPNYCSILFAREVKPLNAFRGAKPAYNSADSMSGMLALKLAFAPYAEHGRFFKSAIETGSHIASLQTVQSGVADVCAIDCVCVALAKKYRPSLLQGLHEIGRSPSVPGLPFITHLDDVTNLRAALLRVFRDESLQDTRSRLLLSGVSVLPEQDYDKIVELESAMEQQGGLFLTSLSGADVLPALA